MLPFRKFHQPDDLLAALEERFESGPAFTKAYVEYFEKAQAVSLRHPRDLKKLNPTQEMWFQYALSTNQRGRDLVREMQQIKPFRDRRYLDIGCGFGGCLVAAAQAGAHGVGLEVDDQRITFARLNLADHDAGPKARVLRQDVLAGDICRQLGSFDLISCNDVAEHVDTVELLFQNISRLLARDGVVYMEIPNRHALDFVAQDGHFGLFGITLLERPEAMAYHWQIFRYTYDVGHYLRLEQYLELFRRFGMRPRVIPTLYHPTRDFSELNDRLKELERAYSRFQGAGPAIDAQTRGLVVSAYESYRKDLLEDTQRTGADGSAAAREHFCNRYLRTFWTFVAVKE